MKLEIHDLKGATLNTAVAMALVEQMGPEQRRTKGAQLAASWFEELQALDTPERRDAVVRKGLTEMLRSDFVGDWGSGGPILDREDIDTYRHGLPLDGYVARRVNGRWRENHAHGATRLEAGLRCFVRQVLGESVEIENEQVKRTIVIVFAFGEATSEQDALALIPAAAHIPKYWSLPEGARDQLAALFTNARISSSGNVMAFSREFEGLEKVLKALAECVFEVAQEKSGKKFLYPAPRNGVATCVFADGGFLEDVESRRLTENAPADSAPSERPREAA